MSIISELDSQLNRNSFEAVTGNPSAQTKAVFKIRVTRATAALAIDLPYAIFGRNFFSNGYGTIIDVPTGLTLTVTNGVISGTPADYGTVSLSYTDGVNTDEINITSQGAAPYPALLEATISDVFKVTKFRLSTSAATLDQLDQDLAVKRNSLFGKNISNTITIDSFKSPDQFQSGIVDIPLEVRFDKSTALTGNMIQSAGVSLNINMDVTQIVKFGSGSL